MASDLTQGTQGVPVTPPTAPLAPPTALPLDTGVLYVIRSSAGRLSQLEDAFIRQLHRDISTLIPDLTRALAAGGWEFCQRMVQVVIWVALTDQPEYVVTDTLRQVGARNRVEGFPEAQYQNVAHALVRAVRGLSGDDWSTSTGSAWISYFVWIRSHLMIGAEQVAAQQIATQQTAAWQEAARQEAARQAAARAQAQAVTGDVDLESVAALLDDEDDDDDDAGYGQIMVEMTRNPRRERP
jgi:hemoglobin-like flavoprotein